VLIGRGKRAKGDQQLTHGNRALVLDAQNQGRSPFPVYEKLAPRLYRYLGDYVAIESTYGELDEAVPGYKVYRFLLAAVSGNDLANRRSDQNVYVDFEDDEIGEMPPTRRRLVRAIVARNRALASKVKKDAGYRCERCGSSSPWRTTQGVPYVEVHHVIPLGEDGFDNVRNMIAVCSDCHRYLHLGHDRAIAIGELREARGI
jgi:5-methylcytosine-specific restriction endonuclease McrA